MSQSWVWGHSLGIPALEEYEEQEFKAILDLVKLSQRGGGREQFHRQGESYFSRQLWFKVRGCTWDSLMLTEYEAVQGTTLQAASTQET